MEVLIAAAILFGVTVIMGEITKAGMFHLIGIPILIFLGQQISDPFIWTFVGLGMVVLIVRGLSTNKGKEA